MASLLPVTVAELFAAKLRWSPRRSGHRGHGNAERIAGRVDHVSSSGRGNSEDSERFEKKLANFQRSPGDFNIPTESLPKSACR